MLSSNNVNKTFLKNKILETQSNLFPSNPKGQTMAKEKYSKRDKEKTDSF